MINRQVYQKDPSAHKLINEGVASVNDDRTREAMVVLRYELETFVCDGQYEKGMAHILETYMKNIQQSEQPAVWISGFFGSGKSHLAKMLRALWMDTAFEDGATSRGIADLPRHIRDILKELSTQGKRHGGLHAASGTLGAGAEGSVRLALLRIIFKSAGLPEKYPLARFVMWLKKEALWDRLTQIVEQNGCDLEEELDNLYVSDVLHSALMEVKPNLFSSSAVCAETLINLYPDVRDVSSDDMLKAVRMALTRDGKFPLTLILLDEVQQYIGEDTQRSSQVQEVVEACCKDIGSKVLFIGTGQTAVTGTSNLKKLEGRFVVRIELSDADVDAVIRKVILAKQPDAIAPIRETMQTNLGEISRHLSGTTIGHRQGDVPFFPQDYPILPVRRRFWENTLRVLDQTGTDSQLRNQLGMIHKTIQTNLDARLGNVIPADYLYFDSSDKLLQARILPRKVHEKTMTWINGSEDERLTARACGLIFLINKLAGGNTEIGIRAIPEIIADLMVEDLSEGSGALRGKLPGLLEKCEILMKVGDEYRIQTEESAAWNDDFLNKKNQLANEAHRIDAERDDRIRQRFIGLAKKISLIHGDARVPRDLYPVFDSRLPADHDKKIQVWVRDEWSVEENTVRADALQDGNQSPTIFVFIPKRSADGLRRNIMDYKAASATLDKRGVPNTPEGAEARAAMDTTKQLADGNIRELLDDCFSGARVFQGGGNEILGQDLREMVHEAAKNSLRRLYPQFHVADHDGWDTVYAKAKKGSPDALKAVGHDDEPSKNNVCKAILGHIAGGKTGMDIRNHFEAPPYGWPRDALDGGLQVLLVAGSVRAQNERGQVLDPREPDRKQIGKIQFKVESATVTTAQRIQVRKLLQKLGCSAKQGEELVKIPEFLEKLRALADRAGGDAPRPEPPDSSALENIRLSSGNEQILSVYNLRDCLKECIDNWTRLAEGIDKRLPAWNQLGRLLGHAADLEEAEPFRLQAQKILRQRLLLADPDLTTPCLNSLAQVLRGQLNRMNERFRDLHEQGMERLRNDPNWDRLEREQRHELMSAQKLTKDHHPDIDVGTTDSILKSLDATPLSVLSDRIAAMPGRFDNVLREAAELMEPEIRFIKIPRRTLKTEDEIDQWLKEAGDLLKTALAQGPVGIS